MRSRRTSDAKRWTHSLNHKSSFFFFNHHPMVNSSISSVLPILILRSITSLAPYQLLSIAIEQCTGVKSFVFPLINRKKNKTKQVLTFIGLIEWAFAEFKTNDMGITKLFAFASFPVFIIRMNLYCCYSENPQCDERRARHQHKKK